MPVTIYVWKAQGGNVGHSALKIEGANASQYVSFWPVDAYGAKQKIKNANVQSTFSESLAEDKRLEGGREPDARIKLNGMHEGAMIARFNQMQGENYNLMNMNCSSFAAELLRVGSRQNPSFQPVAEPARYLSPYLAGSELAARAVGGAMTTVLGQYNVWTPEHVLAYGQELGDRTKTQERQRALVAEAPPRPRRRAVQGPTPGNSSLPVPAPPRQRADHVQASIPSTTPSTTNTRRLV